MQLIQERNLKIAEFILHNGFQITNCKLQNFKEISQGRRRAKVFRIRALFHLRRHLVFTLIIIYTFSEISYYLLPPTHSIRVESVRERERKERVSMSAWEREKERSESVDE